MTAVPIERVVEGDGPRLHALDWCPSHPGDERQVLLLHGLASSAHWWDLVAPLLVERGIRATALDQRGHGESERPASGYAFDDVVADARRAIRELGLQRPLVVGHSWGGTTAVALAASHPDEVSGAVAVDGALDSMRERWSWEEAEERLRPPRIKATREEILGFMSGGPFAAFWSPRLEPIVLSLFENKDDGKLSARFPFEAHMQVVRAIYDANARSWLESTTLPVLLLCARGGGDPEWEASKERFVSSISGAHVSVEWLEDSIHDVPIQHPELVASHIAGFLDARPGA